MNPRKSLLDVLRQNNDPLFQELVEKIIEFYEIEDQLRKTIHGRIFSLLYLSDVRYTYRQVSMKTYTSEETVQRYVAEYNELAKIFISKCK